MSRGTIRLPLQTGAGALRDLVSSALVGALLFWLGAVLCLTGIAGLAEMIGLTELALPGIPRGLVKDAPWQVPFGVLCTGLLVSAGLPRVFFGGLTSARDHRASDIELDDGGLTVKDGRKDGLTASWSSLVPSDCTLEPAVASNVSRFLGTTRYERAFFLRIAGSPELVAETAEPEEDMTVEVVSEAIRSRTEPAARSAPVGADVVSCSACGAPAAPAASESTTCAFCEAVVRMPSSVRDRVRHAAADQSARQRLERAARRVLDHPGSTAVNRSLALAGVGLYSAMLATPIALIAGGKAIDAAIGACAVAALLHSSARASIVQRRALRHVLVGFAAVRGERDLPQCRRCSAPLPHAGEHAVFVRCVYCAADNILGIDFGQRANDARIGSMQLAELLSKRRTAVVMWWLVGAGVLVVAAAALAVRAGG